jgi:tRNA(Ile)-lysidine synthase
MPEDLPENACRRWLEKYEIRDGTLLVAVSGGLDSRVVLEVLRLEAASRGLELVVAHVNHQLRGEESEADAVFVADLARKLGLPFLSRRVSPGERIRNRSSRHRPTLEEAARDLRREALIEMAREAGARWIATGHHAGDQAETVLLRILRGTGPAGLVGMSPRSVDGVWLRPLLACHPDRLRAYAASNRSRGLEWREDASNADPAFSRNRLRAEWIPGLASDFNPQLLRTMCNLAETLREEGEWIEEIVDRAAEDRIRADERGIELALEGWEELPEALARRLVRKALLAAGLERDLSRAHLLRVLAFLRLGRRAGRDKRIELPRGIRLRRLDEMFLLETLLDTEAGADRSRNRANEIDPDDNARVQGRD